MAWGGDKTNGQTIDVGDFKIHDVTLKGSPDGADEVVIWDVAGNAHKRATISSLPGGGGGGVADPGGNGIMVRTSLNVTTARTLTAGDGISVTNGDGVSGNPTIAVSISGESEDTTPANDDWVLVENNAGGTFSKVLLNKLFTLIAFEQPTGTKNGSNMVFTTSRAVHSFVLVFLNGQLLFQGASNDFTLSGTTLTMLNYAPISTDVLVAVIF